MTEKLHVKQRFESHAAFQKCLEDYEEKTGFIFAIKNSQKIENCKVKGPFPPALVYYEKHYRCQFAGTFKTKGAGIRRRRTVKTGCPAEIKIRAHNKTYLEITKFVSEHNHAVDGPWLYYNPRPPPANECSEGDSDQEDSDDLRLMVEAKQQEDSCTSLGAQGETSTKDISNFDIENMTVVLQNSSLEPSDSFSAATSGTTTLQVQRTTTNVSRASEDAISTTSRSTECPASPVDVSLKSNAIGEDLEAMLRFIDDIKKSSSDSLKEPLESTDLSSSSANLENIVQPTKVGEFTEKSKETCDSLVKMRMPIARKAKGCPKGARLNAIGLPKRKNIALPFSKKKKGAKAYDILGWLFSVKLQEAAYSCEHLITKNDVELATKNLPDSFNNEEVDINLVQTYFEDDAFSCLRKAVLKERELASWTCGACFNPIVDDDKTVKFCIMCESCLNWNHSHCVGLSRKPRSSWFCDKCTTD